MITVTQRPFTREEYPEGWARLDAERRALFKRCAGCAVPGLLGLGLAAWFAVQHPAFFWGREVSVGVACMFGAGSVLLLLEGGRCLVAAVQAKLDLNAAAAQGADFMDIVEWEASRAWDCGGEHHSAVLFEVGPGEFVWLRSDDWLDHVPMAKPGEVRTVSARWRAEVRGDFIWSLLPVAGPSVPLIDGGSEDGDASYEVEWSFRLFRVGELPGCLARIVEGGGG